MPARLRAYAELLRLSNVLTAVADVWMGMIVATGSLAPWTVSLPLTAASLLLYLSGMVLNDVFDAKRDAEKRPTRPIPSGRVSRAEAMRLGQSLLIGGIACGATASFAVDGVWPLIVSVLLAIFVFLYDAGVKTSPLAPVNMGVCRALNVCLGFSIGGPMVILAATTAFGMLAYITGFTLFARNEANGGRRLPLVFATFVSACGLTFFYGTPLEIGGLASGISVFRWSLLWLVIALLIGRRYAAAILQPTPGHVQAAVGNAIQGIILIDAALAWGYAGPFWGLAILALLPPTMLMARFIPQT